MLRNKKTKREIQSHQSQRPIPFLRGTAVHTHTSPVAHPGPNCESPFISPTPSLIEENIVCTEQYVFISISLLFRKGNVCTSKGLFEEQPFGRPVQVGSCVGSAGCAGPGLGLGGCPPQPPSRPAPSRQGSGAGEEKTNTWKNTRGF